MMRECSLDFRGTVKFLCFYDFIHGLTAEIETGKIYAGKVTSIVSFGIFVEILPGKEGLCHILAFVVARIENLADHVKKDDPVSVKVLDINERGQIKLSRKVAL